jgi:hypothetical protein
MTSAKVLSRLRTAVRASVAPCDARHAAARHRKLKLYHRVPVRQGHNAFFVTLNSYSSYAVLPSQIFPAWQPRACDVRFSGHLILSQILYTCKRPVGAPDEQAYLPGHGGFGSARQRTIRAPRQGATPSSAGTILHRVPATLAGNAMIVRPFPAAGQKAGLNKPERPGAVYVCSCN